MENEKTKRAYKDSLFRELFKQKENFLSLYNAITGANLKDTRALKENTLAAVLHSTLRNDVSFQIGSRWIVLLEEQSSVNGNMPLRMFLYLAELYRTSVPKEALYRKKTQPLTAPQFFVLYVGDEDVPAEQELHLSDAFEGDTHDLELTVHLFNVTAGKSSRLLERCRILYEYSEFVWQVEKRRAAGLSRDEAIHAAIAYCQANGILKTFLKAHEMEVYDMVSTQWDMDTALKVRGAEERAEGRMEGRAEGRVEGRTEGFEQTALGMLKEKLPLAQIARITKLSAEKITDLGKKHGLL